MNFRANRVETWVEIVAYQAAGPLSNQKLTSGLRGPIGVERRTEKLIEGRWLRRWWERVR